MEKSYTLFAIFLLAIGGCANQHSQLADADIRVQLEKMCKAHSSVDRGRAMGRLQEYKLSGRMSSKQWVDQVVQYVNSMEMGQDSWVGGFYLAQFSIFHLRVIPSEFLTSIAPYLDSNDEQLSHVASDMSDAAIAADFEPSKAFDPTSPRFEILDGYLRASKRREPSWTLVHKFYVFSPEVALETTANALMDPSEHRAIRRIWKEMSALVYLREIAQEDEITDLDRKIHAKLEVLSRHLQWCVRAYAIAVTYRNLRAFNPRLTWGRDSKIPQQLAQDANPLVSRMARDVTERAAFLNALRESQ